MFQKIYTSPFYSGVFHKYKEAANTMSRLSNVIDSANLFSKSELPIDLAADIISLSNSSNLLIALIMLPSNVSVNAIISMNLAPYYQSILVLRPFFINLSFFRVTNICPSKYNFHQAWFEFADILFTVNRYLTFL